MKTTLILNLLTVFTFGTITAQVGIDKDSGFGANAILEFGSEARGIRLTPVADATTLTATGGTIVFDGATGSFRYYDGTSWSTAIAGGTTGGAPAAADSTTQGVLIGTNSSSAQGVLILGADTGETKALVLPNINLTEARIPNPAVGLMVYDTASGTVRVFNGNSWTNF